MDFYAIFKLLHVLSALAWVGGGLTLMANSILSIRQKGELATIRAAGTTASLGKYWFMPASLLTLVFGLATTTIGGLWSELWVILGLAGFASAYITGAFVFEPTSRTMGAALAEGREADAVATGRSLMRVMKFDYTVMLLVIADMVLKPTLHDVAVLAAMGVVLLAAIAFFLVAPARSEPRLA